MKLAFYKNHLGDNFFTKVVLIKNGVIKIFNLKKELAMEIKRKSTKGDKKEMDKFVNDLISEEASEEIRHFDGRMTKNERRFSKIQISNFHFDKILDQIIELVATEALIELESDRIRAELEVRCLALSV